MAQKYKSSLKQKGFKPQQVSNAGVQRILEEGARQANVLRDQFAFEKSQRDMVLRTMKENAALEKQDRQTNFNLETQNKEAIQRRRQDNFRIRGENLEQQGKDQNKIWQSLSSLSSTAAKKVEELEQAKFDADYMDQLNQIMIAGPDFFKQAEFQTQEDELQVASIENEFGADALAAAGGTPLEVQRVRSLSKGRQYANDKARTMFAMQEFLPFAKNYLATNMPEVEDPDEKRVIIQSLLEPFLKEKGIYGLKPEFLTPALLETNKAINTYMQEEKENYTNMLQEKATEQSTVAFLGNIDNMQVNALRLFKDLTTQYGSRTIALDKLFEIAQTLDENEWEAFGDIVMPGQSAPLRVIQERRWIETGLKRTARVEEIFTNRLQAQERDAKTYEQQVFELFSKNPNKITAAAVKQAQATYRSLSGGKESGVIDSFSTETLTAQGKESLKDYLTGLADTGKLTTSILDNVADVDIRFDKTLRAAAEQNEKLYNNDSGKRKKESLKNLVLTVNNQFSPEGRVLTGDAEIILTQLEQKFDARVLELRANKPEMSVSEAQNTAYLDVEKEFVDGLEKENNLYYYQKRGGKKGFSNVSQLAASDDDKAAISKRVRDLNNILTSGGNVKAQLEQTPELVFTKPQALEIISSYYTPGYKTPALVRQLAASITSMTEVDIINAQLKALDMPELPPPPSMALLGDIAPEIRSGLQNAETSVRSTRFLSQTGRYNEAAIPKGYGSTITEAAAQFDIPAPVLAGLIEAESSWNNNAVSRAGARGLAQFMPGTAAQFGVDVTDPTSSIFGAAEYLRHLMDNYGFDLRTAIYAYNAGPGIIQKYGIGASRENMDYYPKVMRGAAKYGLGPQSFVEPALLRTSMEPEVAYIAGNIGSGPYYTGQHTDVKQTNGQEFSITDLDDYVEVEDPELGRVPLSKVGVTGDFKSHTDRNSHGIDYGTLEGSRIYLKNGAMEVLGRDSGDGNGDVLVFTLPDGREFQFLHGTLPE